MTAPIVQLGRYELLHPIASGGMATVYEGKLVGPAGFARRVAIKRMHPQFASDPEFVAMFLDEARLAARIRHPNVVATLDVVTREGELLIVMEYVQGETLATLARQARERGEGVPVPVALAVLRGALAGLHAAHEASEDGAPLGIVHRDVSPQNLLVGVDGVTRILDFGIAKASGRAAATREGELKGKLRYMSPEQVSRRKVDRRSDVYAAAAVLWEALTGQRLIDADDAGATVLAIVQGRFAAPSTLVDGLPAGLDAVVARGLAGDPDVRFGTALEMARALEPLGPAPLEDVGAWVQRTAGDALARGSLAHIPPVGRASLATATLPVGDGPLIELVALDAPLARADTAGAGSQAPVAVEAMPSTSGHAASGAAAGGDARGGPDDVRDAAELAQDAQTIASRRRRVGIVAAVLLLAGAIGLWAVVAPRGGGATAETTTTTGTGTDTAATTATATGTDTPAATATDTATATATATDTAAGTGTGTRAGTDTDADSEAGAGTGAARVAPPGDGAARAGSGAVATAVPRGASRAAKVAPRPKPAAAANCDPPFVHDAEGNRVYKKGCY